MEKKNNFTEADHIAFGFNYNGGKPTEIIVDKISGVFESGKLLMVHFLYGYKSLSEMVKPEDVLAIGNEKGEWTIRGWSGRYDVFQPEHPLIKEYAEKQEPASL